MPRESLIAAWSTAATPPPLLTVSQWADAKRRLPETSGASGALWRTDATPYLRGIMDAVHEPGVRIIAVRKGAQLGGSEALHNIIGYFIEHDPCPMLFVHPTSAVAEEWSKERLADMIRQTPALSAVVREKRPARGSGESESTLSLKLFPGGYLALGGANTPNTFARRAVRIAVGDDVDRFPAVVGDEGDPADLLINRTTTFYDALVLFVSTPTMKGGRIDTLYERSDKRQFVVACPMCQHRTWITWNDPARFRVGFDDRDPESARLECPSCQSPLSEAARRLMVQAGAWEPTAEPKEPGLVGFHAPSMLSTLGNVTLSSLVSKWLTARSKGKESLRVFINTSLAEGWEDRGARMEPHTLMGRREDYGEGVEVPAAAVVLTAGVDVQEDRFELQVFAWGPSAERWVVDWRSIPGSPKLPETRAALLVALTRRYAHAGGHQLPILATCVDSGYATEEVYDFVLAHQARRIFATKGFAGKSGEPIVGKPSERRYGRSARPVRLYPVNVDDAKAEIVGSLAVVTAGAGAMHFPLQLETITEEYFAQLCAEHRETRYNKSGVATHSVWVLDRDRNEALDTAVLALAAFRLLNPNIRQMASLLAGAAPSPPAAEATEGTPPATPARPPPRRVSRSPYLDG
jgi:phage terminase large subunit GpA-like protein